MAKAEPLYIPQQSLREKIKTFINAELINILAAILFLLLAVFLLYPDPRRSDQKH